MVWITGLIVSNDRGLSLFSYLRVANGEIRVALHQSGMVFKSVFKKVFVPELD